MLSEAAIKSKSKDISIKLPNLIWILFLGVLPFDKAALTIYYSSTLGEYISFALNAVTLLLALISFYNKRHDNSKKAMCMKYIFFFFMIAFLYLFAGLVDNITLTRFLSIACLLGYYLFAICWYESITILVRDVNRALFFLIGLSIVLYLVGNQDVLYIENATVTVFKGVASNRNSYSEITLFYLVTSFYLGTVSKNKLTRLWYFFAAALAVYTTFLTQGATSIISTIILLALLIGSFLKSVKKIFSFNVFVVFYLLIFFLLVVAQNSELSILNTITEIFNKSSSLSGRTDIWTTSISYIWNSIFTGYGFDTEVLLNHGIIENDPHNSILYTLLTQGISGLLLLIYMLSFVLKNSKNIELRKNNLYFTMEVFLVVWFIKGLVESVFSYTHFVFWCALIIMERLSLDSKQRKLNG